MIWQSMPPCLMQLKRVNHRSNPTFVVAVLTIKMPIAILEKEGITMEKIKEEFNGLKKEMSEEAPPGAELKMEIHLE